MRFHTISVLVVVVSAVLLLLAPHVLAQEKSEREIHLHKNVKLIEMAALQEMKKEFKSEFQRFLPLFEEVLSQCTTDRPPESALTVWVSPGVRKVGSAKTERCAARVTAFKKNSKWEFVGSLLLYSYANRGPVNREEITDFLKQQILGPMK